MMRGGTNASNIGGNVGSDTRPIKIVNGVATPVSYDLLTTQGNQNITGAIIIQNVANFNAYQDSAGGQTLIATRNTSTQYTSRLVIAIQNDNTANLILQKFDNNGGYIGGTIVATL